MQFERLLSPIHIGSTALRNRVVMGAMHTRLDSLDHPTERLVEFYRARARGGVSLILTGGVAPNPDGRIDPDTSVLDNRDALETQGHVRICQAVHEQGSAIALQILHAGRYAKVPGCTAPTPTRAPIGSYQPRVMSTTEVWDIIGQYVKTSTLAREAGYDGVEIMGSEGYLINEFTAERTNHRNDIFGGDRDGRFRLPVEVVKAVRAALGKGFLLIYRISAIDLVSNGLTADEVTDLAQRIEAAGADVLNSGYGWHESTVPTVAASVPRAAWVSATRRIKCAVSIPVIASNRINTPDVAERILMAGDCDLVSMARPLLADPDFARKIATGQASQICTCIGCNQACLDAIFAGHPASCMVNPIAGRELDFLDRPPPRVHKRVAIVGAGPAGCAYAIAAAERGHCVTIFDAGVSIGGQMNLAKEVPGKSDFNEALRYFAVRLQSLGVRRELNHRVTVRDLVDRAYDQVILATGTTPRVPDIPGITAPNVLTYAQVLSGEKHPGQKVAIIGAGGIGFDVADYLLCKPEESLDAREFFNAWDVDPTISHAGGVSPVPRHQPRQGGVREVTLMQRKPGRLGRSLGKSTGWILRTKLRRAGLHELSGVAYQHINEQGLHYSINGESRLLKVDSIIICAGQQTERSLYEPLGDIGIHPRLVGGAHVADRLDAVRAIKEATEAAYEL